MRGHGFCQIHKGKNITYSFLCQGNILGLIPDRRIGRRQLFQNIGSIGNQTHNRIHVFMALGEFPDGI